MATLRIGGVDMPEPALNGLTVTREPIWSANTGRSTNGTMTGDIVARKIKISVQWNVLTNTEVAKIENAISTAFFDVTYPDPKTKANKTIKMYAGTPTYPVYDYRNGAFRYVGVALDLIEK